MLTGDLTIKAVTRPVEFEVEFLGVDPTGLQGESRIGFSARGAIMRRDFGITFGLAADSKIVIGDKVDITLDVEAVLDSYPEVTSGSADVFSQPAEHRPQVQVVGL